VRCGPSQRPGRTVASRGPRRDQRALLASAAGRVAVDDGRRRPAGDPGRHHDDRSGRRWGAAGPLRPATTTGGAQPSGPAGTSGDRDARIDAALASVHFDWRHLLPGWTLAFLGPRSGLQGNTLPGSRRVEIYVRPTFTTGQLAQVIAHEIGHAVDVSYFDDADRRAFNVLRGRDPGAAWWVADGQSDFASGAGDWAESFASWATGGLGTWASRLGPPPDAAQRAAIGRLLSAAIG
jgi:hypothetical protein